MLSTKTPKIQNNRELPLFDRVALALLFLLLLSEVLGGAVRYYAVQFGFPWLVYLPHLLIFLALVPIFFVYLANEGVTVTYLTVLTLFGVGTVYGLFNLGNSDQVEFGFWVFAAFLYGIVALPSVVHGWRRLIPYALVLWAFAVVGVLINFFYTWPWAGMDYQVGGTSVEASRLWWDGGITRLAGFSRASFDAALQILILCLFLGATLRRRWWIPVWILSGIAIALTTHKTAVIIFIVFSATRAFRRNPTRRLWRLVPSFLVGVDVLLPFSMLVIKLDWLKFIRSPVWYALVASFVKRMQTGWPVWLRMIAERGNVLLGRGLGGIGAAQQYFEPALFSPGDNIAVYLYGTFGVLGLVLLFVYARNAARIDVKGQVGRFFFFCACLILLEGVTVNVLEDVFTAIVLGASFRYLQEGYMARPMSSLACRERLRGLLPTSLPRSAVSDESRT